MKILLDIDGVMVPEKSWKVPNQNRESFVIIDDDKSLYDLPAEYQNSLVITSTHIGLNEDFANKAIDVFRNGH